MCCFLLVQLHKVGHKCKNSGPGWGVEWEGRDVTSTGTGVCITHSVEKSFLAQCWWAPGVTSLQLQHWPDDISYQITLTAATSQ